MFVFGIPIPLIPLVLMPKTRFLVFQFVLAHRTYNILRLRIPRTVFLPLSNSDGHLLVAMSKSGVDILSSFRSLPRSCLRLRLHI